jgi:hypothetical protein
MKTLVEGNLEECGRHPLGRPTHAHVGVYGEVQDGGGEVDDTYGTDGDLKNLCLR